MASAGQLMLDFRVPERSRGTMAGRDNMLCVRLGNRSAVLGGTDLVVGRSSYCSLVVDNADVSRVHAVFRRKGDQVELQDLGSRNGTSVRGKRIGREPVVVAPGDEIRLAQETLVLEATSSFRHNSRTLDAPTYQSDAPDDDTNPHVEELLERGTEPGSER